MSTSIKQTSSPDSTAWKLVYEITDQLGQRYPADVLAVGVHGALAHGDSWENADIDLAVTTYQPDCGPKSTKRVIDGRMVRLEVKSSEERLNQARTLTTSWPLIADRYLNLKAVYDEKGWHDRLCNTHLKYLTEIGSREFNKLARESWCVAHSRYQQAMRSLEWFDSDGALLLLADTRIAMALTEGLMTRTYFRDKADAGKRTGFSAADAKMLVERLKTQAAQLTERGYPINGIIADLLYR